jgi:hypothetical protein
MALVAIPGLNIAWPDLPPNLTFLSSVISLSTMNATGIRAAMLGNLMLEAGASGSKTLSAAGGGKIHFRTGSVTWANASTLLRIGLQDIDFASGAPPRPDGTFDVSADLVPGVNALAANGWVSFVMDSGSKTLDEGDPFAFVLDMVARAGTDSVQANVNTSNGSGGFPICIQDPATGVWANLARSPNCIIEFDDGTLGTFYGSLPKRAVSSGEVFATGTNPNERGLIFQVPFSCKIRGLWVGLQAGNVSTSSFELSLYEDPLGTPAALYTEAFGPAYTEGTNSLQPRLFVLPSEITLTPNTDYCIAVLATGAGNININVQQVSDEAHRFAYPNGMHCRKGARNGATAFAETDTIIPMMGVLISQLDDGSGGGGGGTFPDEGDVRDGTVYGATDELTGTFAVPAEADVKSGTQYGAAGTEFTGSLSTGGGGGSSSGRRISGMFPFFHRP